MKKIAAIFIIIVLTVCAVLPSFAADCYGDIDGDGNVNSSDAMIILKSSVGMLNLTSLEIKKADVNKDGNINSLDALSVLQISVGTINSQIADNSEFLVPTEEDWKNLDHLFEILMDLEDNYNCETATTKDIINQIYDGIGNLSPYEYLSNDSVETVYNSKDPLGVFKDAEHGFSSISIEKVNWIAKNVFNIEPEIINELKYRDNIYMYSYNGRYYINTCFGYGLEDWYSLNINSYNKSDDGKYRIICDKIHSFGYDGEFKTEKVCVAAALKNINGEHVWSIYSIDNIYNTDPNAIIPTEKDFETLEEILSNDGGYILNNNFDYKTASKNDFINIAGSYGFVPAYREYIDNNIFSDKDLIDIDNDEFSEMSVDSKAFNWVMKNVYNCKNMELTNSADNNEIFTEDKVYFWLPPDEGGISGEFHEKGHYERDGIYTIEYSLYQYYNPYEYNSFLVHTADYTVTAEFKEVDNVDGTQKVRVWSIYSIERNSNAY